MVSAGRRERIGSGADADVVADFLRVRKVPLRPMQYSAAQEEGSMADPQALVDEMRKVILTDRDLFDRVSLAGDGVDG